MKGGDGEREFISVPASARGSLAMGSKWSDRQMEKRGREEKMWEEEM